MKQYSLRRRLIAAVLALECGLVLGLSCATLLYLWHEQMRSFDRMVRGRADSLLGQVHDAEDPNDNVAINLQALDLRSRDLWMAQDSGRRILAQSAGWNSEAVRSFGSKETAHNFRVNGRAFRGLILHGIRVIDAEDGGAGIPRAVTIYYAAPLHPVFETIGGAAEFLVAASLLLLLVTAGVLALLLRRGLAPLEELSSAAAEMTPKRPRFAAPRSAQTTTELAVLAGALESATRRLEEAFVQQKVFVNDAAHELKTAVTIIKSSLQLLASRPRSTREYARGLETCMADCARMEELVQRMLQLARFEREPATGDVECDMAEVARDVAAHMARLAEIRSVTIAVQAPASAPTRLDRDACASLLANLLLNAVQHTPEGGSVTASIALDDAVVAEIRDTGRGIAPEDLPHLFERFWRGDHSRARSTGGAGLGLSICKAIVDSCAGEITVTSRLGEGTCVRVKLPLVGSAETVRELSAVS
ncbi:MAG: sensor histidine kinase [Acidobacteriota bacterium]